MVVNEIAIKENGMLMYKEVTDSDLIVLQKEIEKNIRFHHFKVVNADEISVSMSKNNHGNIIINYKGYATTESIYDICSADIGEELSVKEAIALNIHRLLDNLDNLVFLNEQT